VIALALIITASGFLNDAIVSKSTNNGTELLKPNLSYISLTNNSANELSLVPKSDTITQKPINNIVSINLEKIIKDFYPNPFRDIYTKLNKPEIINLSIGLVILANQELNDCVFINGKFINCGDFIGRLKLIKINLDNIIFSLEKFLVIIPIQAESVIISLNDDNAVI
jgi:hypothetical protein